MKRYHPALVALHWITMLLLFAALLGGSLNMAPMSNSDPQKLEMLRLHMIIGNVILALMVLRLVVRLRSEHPPSANMDNRLQNKAASLVHIGLYLFVFLMIASGWGTALAADLPAILFGGSGAVLPEDFYEFAPRLVHRIVFILLSLLIVLHIVAALYHQFVQKDHLLGRMWFGKRKG
ncbi:MAG: cytochrome b/b6 domain-containing protein [Rhodobacteraceae bacterium]|nr:cytochrome b/b6 domain-containing protein [Paracoccaceae bacterium]